MNKKGNRREFQIGSFGGMNAGKVGVKRDKLIGDPEQEDIELRPVIGEALRETNSSAAVLSGRGAMVTKVRIRLGDTTAVQPFEYREFGPRRTLFIVLGRASLWIEPSKSYPTAVIIGWKLRHYEFRFSHDCDVQPARKRAFM